MTNSDKHGLPPRTIHSLGQESVAHSVTGCMWQQADFPADAFLSRCYRSSARMKTGVHHKHERCT